jgi:hypothetical protein
VQVRGEPCFVREQVRNSLGVGYRGARVVEKGVNVFVYAVLYLIESVGEAEEGVDYTFDVSDVLVFLVGVVFVEGLYNYENI